MGDNSLADAAGVVFCASDKAVELASRFRSDWSKRWTVLGVQNDSPARFLDKAVMAGCAREAGFAIPSAFVVRSERELTAANDCVWPARVIVKPLDSLILGKDAFCVTKDRSEALDAARSIMGETGAALVQEYVASGGPDEVVEVMAFRGCAPTHRFAVCSLVKRRTYPEGIGSSSFVRTQSRPALAAATKRLLELLDYQGVADVEVVVRDDVAWFIEMNVRCGAPVGLSARSGINLPALAYCDALGLDVREQGSFREGLWWMREAADWKNARHGVVSWTQFLRDVARTDEFQLLAADDPMPAVRAALSTAKRVLRSSCGCT